MSLLARPLAAGRASVPLTHVHMDLGIGRKFRFSQKVNGESVYLYFFFLSPRIHKRMFCVSSAAEYT